MLSNVHLKWGLCRFGETTESEAEAKQILSAGMRKYHHNLISCDYHHTLETVSSSWELLGDSLYLIPTLEAELGIISRYPQGVLQGDQNPSQVNFTARRSEMEDKHVTCGEEDWCCEERAETPARSDFLHHRQEWDETREPKKNKKRCLHTFPISLVLSWRHCNFVFCHCRWIVSDWLPLVCGIR